MTQRMVSFGVAPTDAAAEREYVTLRRFPPFLRGDWQIRLQVERSVRAKQLPREETF